jgi:hypothetical protein
MTTQQKDVMQLERKMLEKTARTKVTLCLRKKTLEKSWWLMT